MHKNGTDEATFVVVCSCWSNAHEATSGPGIVQQVRWQVSKQRLVWIAPFFQSIAGLESGEGKQTCPCVGAKFSKDSVEHPPPHHSHTHIGLILVRTHTFPCTASATVLSLNPKQVKGWKKEDQLKCPYNSKVCNWSSQGQLHVNARTHTHLWQL